MAVDDLPFAVLAPVDVGDADRDRRDGTAVDGPVEAFEAHGIGEVAANVGDLDIKSKVADVGRPPC